MKNRYFILCLFILSILMVSCDKNINKKLRNLEVGQYISLSELSGSNKETVYVLTGEISEELFYKHCKNIEIKQPYEKWEIALLFVDTEKNGEVFFLERYYNSLDVDYFTLDITPDNPYKARDVLIKKEGYNKYKIFLQ